MKKEKKNNKLKYLFVILFLTTLLLSSSSYAWFTTNRIVTIETLNVHVAVKSGIEVSADGINWKGTLSQEDIISVHDTTYKTSVNQIPYSFEPVSTAGDIDRNTGFLKLYYGIAKNNNEGTFSLTTERSIETESNGMESTGKFIAFDMFLKVNGDNDLYITNTSGAIYEGEDELGIENAVRAAFIIQGTVPVESDVDTIQGLNDGTKAYIWEPNYDTHTEFGVKNALDVYGITVTQTNGRLLTYDGVIAEIPFANNIKLSEANEAQYPVYFKKVNVDYATTKEFPEFEQIFSLSPGITKMRIYVWIEGQDVDCENNASVGDISFNLQFSTNPA